MADTSNVFAVGVPDLSERKMREREEGGKEREKKKKKTEAKQHFLFERKQEKAGGARFWSPL